MVAFFPSKTIYISLILIILGIELFRKKDNGWDLFSIFSFSVLWIYVIVPFLLILFPDKQHFRMYVDAYDFQLMFFQILTFYLVTLGTYYFSKNKSKNFYFHLSQEKLITIAVIFLIIGVTSFLIYANLYGGISGLISNSLNIRLGINKTQDGLVLFQKTALLLNFTLWIGFSIFIINKRIKYKFFPIILILIILCTIQALSTAGRSQVLFVFLPLIFGYYKWKKRSIAKWKLTSLISICFLFIIYGEYIFTVINSGYNYDIQVNSGNAFWDFIREFVHPSISLININSIPYYNLEIGFFKDFIGSIMELFPQRILNLPPIKSISYYNTFLLVGKNSGHIPPGIIGYFYLNMYFWGIIFGGLAIGFLLKVTDQIFKKLNMVHPVFCIFYVGIGYSLFGLIMGGDPSVYINLYFWGVWIGVIFVLLLTKKSKVEIKK
jgi:oligosaccharide repeat unit polymerase